MNRQEFLNFIEANGASWDEYEAFAKGFYDSIKSIKKGDIGEFNPDDQDFQLAYSQFILGIH